MKLFVTMSSVAAVFACVLTPAAAQSIGEGLGGVTSGISGATSGATSSVAGATSGVTSGVAGTAAGVAGTATGVVGATTGVANATASTLSEPMPVIQGVQQEVVERLMWITVVAVDGVPVGQVTNLRASDKRCPMLGLAVAPTLGIDTSGSQVWVTPNTCKGGSVRLSMTSMEFKKMLVR